MRKKIIIGCMLSTIILLMMPYVSAIETQKTNKIFQDSPLNEAQSCFKYEWNKLKRIIGSETNANSHLGYSVCIDDDIAILGEYNNPSLLPGKAYIFKKTGDKWNQEAILTASDGGPFNMFGYSVAIKDDRAIVGAINENLLRGAAYIFEKSGGSWTQQAKLTASDGQFEDFFGCSVSIDGDIAIVGSECNKAYIFTRNGGSWSQEKKLTGSNDFFGFSVCLEGDLALIGAYGDDEFGSNSGAAYIFERSAGSWSQQAKLKASDNESGDNFGYSVSIDGDTIVIGAAGGSKSYVFTSNGGSWSQEAKLIASDGANDDYFGCSVSVYGDFALIGAYGHNGNGENTGAAYVFVRSEGSWCQEAKLTASESQIFLSFGHSVSIYGDTAFIGAPGYYLYGPNTGAVYIFIREFDGSPTPPEINGPFHGNVTVEYEYTFKSTQYFGDDLYYFVDWGDDTNSGWIGPYSSGEEINLSHNWTNIGYYFIRAKAKDTNNNVSEWSRLGVGIHRNRNVILINWLINSMKYILSGAWLKDILKIVTINLKNGR